MLAERQPATDTLPAKAITMAAIGATQEAHVGTGRHDGASITKPNNAPVTTPPT